MKKTLLYIGVLLSSLWGTAQENYQFTDLINIDSTPVISQGNTGTCWSFSTSSFILPNVGKPKNSAICSVLVKSHFGSLSHLS